MQKTATLSASAIAAKQSQQKLITLRKATEALSKKHKPTNKEKK
jgi:hypothetical protein